MLSLSISNQAESDKLDAGGFMSCLFVEALLTGAKWFAYLHVYPVAYANVL